jgi:hypothetical protein
MNAVRSAVIQPIRTSVALRSDFYLVIYGDRNSSARCQRLRAERENNAILTCQDRVPAL